MMCVSPTGKEFLGAIDTLGHMKDAVYIADVIKRYVIDVVLFILLLWIKESNCFKKKKKKTIVLK